MSSTTSQNHPCPSYNEYFKLVILEQKPSFIIGAQHESAPHKCKLKLVDDLRFNLSAVLGNDDGKFAWGRMDFQNTGADFTLGKDGVLRGKLLDLAGVYQEVDMDLHKELNVESYVEYTIREGHRMDRHKLKETKSLASKVKPVPRTLILCFDGTSNQFNIENTNVVKLVELLRKDDPARQMVYYQTGVGTYAPPGLMTSVGLEVASIVDQGVAWYLYQHVIDGYRFLMQTYRAGDRIALFGFSRGAFTARALAGMLHCVGLLPAHNAEHVPFAYKVYSNARDETKSKPKSEREHPKHPPYVQVQDNKSMLESLRSKLTEAFKPTEAVKPEDFKRIFSVPVVIDFVGVWDTVASVGAITTQELPFIAHNPSILVFRQALALDERRGSFIPSLWNHSLTQRTQDVREVWFRGEHSDIGGGSPDLDNSPGRLSDISLRWMVRQIIDSKAGLWFDHVAAHNYWKKDIIQQIHPRSAVKPDKKWANERLEESIKLDAVDVENKCFDSIGRRPLLWNFLEYFGFNSKLKANVNFEAKWTRWPNCRAPREIYAEKRSYPIFIHSSVVYHILRQEEDRIRKSTEGAPWRYIYDRVVDFMLRKESKPDYTPRAIWHYKKDRWPQIEDVLPHDPVSPTEDKSAYVELNNEIPRLDMKLICRRHLRHDQHICRLPEAPPLQPGKKAFSRNEFEEQLLEEEEGWWPVAPTRTTVAPTRTNFVGYALLATVWLSLLSVVPKSELAKASLFLESSLGSWF